MSSTPERVDYIRKIAKKDEQIRTQDELMTKGKEEILRLRAAVAELVAEKEELRQHIAIKEKADRELEEAEADRMFRVKQQEFGDLLNRYETSFPFRYRKFYINPYYFSNSSASGNGKKYNIPRKQTTTEEEPLKTSGQCDHIVVSPVGTFSTPAPHPGGAAAPAPRDPSSGSSTPSTLKSEPGESHRFTKLPPYCKKFLKGECSFGASCRFIHVSEGKLFAYLVNKNLNLIFPRKETKNPGISEARQTQRATVLGGSSDQGCQPHPCRQNQPKIDAQHHKFLAECSRLELKLIQLHFTTPMYDVGNKSIKATSEFSGHLTKTNKASSKKKPCKLNSAKSQPKNTLKDFKASGKTKGLVHRSLSSKRKKTPQSKTPHSDLNILSHNIRGLASRKVSLEDILETNNVDICCVQEVNNKNPPKFKNYVQFNRFSKLRMHGVMILVHNSLRQHVIRVPDESQLECVHVRLNHTTPALNIIGLYLDVESRNTIDELDEKFSILSNKVDEILEKSEGCLIIGDWNRPELFSDKRSYATNQLKEWLGKDKVTLLNDNTPTRINPTGGSSVLDLGVVSKNIENFVQSFEVDTDKSFTPFAIRKVKGVHVRKHSDHLAVKALIRMPVLKKKKTKSKPVINFRNEDGWAKYAEISNKKAPKIKELVETIDDMDELERRVHLIDLETQVEAFGIIYQKSNKKKTKRRDSKELNELVKQQSEELDKILSQGYLGKDLNSRIYKMKTAINGPKHKKQEPMAINDPVTKELLVNEEAIKSASLLHNIKILTKNKPLIEDLDKIKQKEEKHEQVMKMQDKDEWELTYKMYEKVTKKIKDKNKKMYELYNKAGESYKVATYEYMKKLIKSEQVPTSFLDTYLTQLWKGKGSALDLNNMRFIHMRFWRSRLLEALVTENMKEDIVKACPNNQLGGMPGAMSVEHLVVLKTWMKQKEQQKESGIFNVFDMSKFFDKESLLDCMNVLNTHAKISNKSYRMWYKLNEGTRISVKTSVGETDKATIFDSIGQGSVGAALVSALNIGVAIKETFTDQYTANIGQLSLNTLIFQDDISKMNDNIEQAREGCHKIDRTLKSKLLSANYDKSKFLIIGKEKFRKNTLKTLEKDPLQMGGVKIEHSEQEQYLGDWIHEKGCKESITVTIKARIRKLISRTEEILQLVETPGMSSLGGANTAFKLYEAQILPPLLYNCESWISIDDSHIKLLQDFQERFIRRILRLANSVPKVMLEFDTGMPPMKWRIAQRKLIFVNRIMAKPVNNITRKVLMQETIHKIKGLATESRTLCLSLGLPSVMTTEVTKNEIKQAIKARIREECLKRMQEGSKSKDRVDLNPDETQYLQRLSLSNCRVYFRYRSRCIALVKMNQKGNKPSESLTCRFCTNNLPETQEHLEMCEGTKFERRGVRISEVMGRVIFWRRMMKKMTQKTATVTSPEVRLPDAPCGGP